MVVRYLQLEDVLRQVQRLGFVVRDAGLLAGALARPQASAFGDGATGRSGTRQPRCAGLGPPLRVDRRNSK
jgi:hypothetical protein